MARQIVHIEIEVVAKSRFDAWEKTEKALNRNISGKTLKGFCGSRINTVTTRRD